MPTRYKVLFMIVASAIVLSATWVLGYAYYPGRWPSEYPVSLRLPEVAYDFPITQRFVLWDARHHAREAHANGKRLLLGMRMGGTDFGLGDTCEVSSYQRGRFRGEDLPAWAVSSGLKGTVTLSCGTIFPSGELEFTVVEIGCIDYGPTFAYAGEYNRQVLELERRHGSSSARLDRE